MNNLLKFDKFFESKSNKEKRGETPYELPYILNQLPETVDYRLIEFILQNYGKEYYKSPWSHSYYSDKVGWTFKPDMSYRLANHWNFRTKSGDQKIIHCPTTSDVGEHNTNWTIGQFDGNSKKYNVILSYPFIISDENMKKRKELREKYFKDYKYKPNYKSPFKKMNDEEKQQMIDSYRFITTHVPLMDFYVDGEKVELLKWGKRSIKFERNGEKEIISQKDLDRVSYIGIYNGKTIIEKSVRGDFIISKD